MSKGHDNLIPAEQGNGRAITHGAYAVGQLEPRAEEIAEALRSIVPVRTESDEPAIRRLALIEARCERAETYLAEHDVMDRRGRPRPILKVLSTWENTATRLYAALGLTPLSRSQLGVNVSRFDLARQWQEEAAK